jgi:type II secretory ATPase GspE/PulE/Tfp pilus assembly ATPase PilB-like protein
MSKKIVADVFNYARAEGASGLVITSQADRVALHYHFPDEVGRELSFPKKLEKSFLTDLRQVLGLAEGELLAKKYYKISDPKFRLDFYLSVLPAADGEKIIIDIIRRPAAAWRLPQLGLQRRDRQELEGTLRRDAGLIVVSAPAGGGKSATLRAILVHINKAEKNIYLLDKAAASGGATDATAALAGINCLPPSQANWEKVLKNDCDVIAAEDCDDAGALAMAIRAAAEGRLILITLTADDSFGALDKILKINLPLRLKLGALKLIVGQRLVALKKARRAGRGTRREIGLFEIFRLSPEIKKFILTAKDKDLTAPKFLNKLRTRARADGFRSREIDRRQKIRAGLISPI